MLILIFIFQVISMVLIRYYVSAGFYKMSLKNIVNGDIKEPKGIDYMFRFVVLGIYVAAFLSFSQTMSNEFINCYTVNRRMVWILAFSTQIVISIVNLIKLFYISIKEYIFIYTNKIYCVFSSICLIVLAIIGITLTYFKNELNMNDKSLLYLMMTFFWTNFFVYILDCNAYNMKTYFFENGDAFGSYGFAQRFFKKKNEYALNIKKNKIEFSTEKDVLFSIYVFDEEKKYIEKIYKGENSKQEKSDEDYMFFCKYKISIISLILSIITPVIYLLIGYVNGINLFDKVELVVSLAFLSITFVVIAIVLFIKKH